MSSIYTSGNDTYFYSNKIKVFPCAYRSSTYDATARLNTEYNFTHLPHAVDKASYIIEFTEEKLICVIQGYYFEIELGDDDYTALNYNEETKKYKYLNICVASPNGAGSIESPHLCSWDSSDGVEATLDGKPEGSDYYIFKGLKIGEEELSNGSYQCYALKLDASAKLPIMANKIENIADTGKSISQEFTTETLSATTSISTPELMVAKGKLTAKSDGIAANVPVTINNTLEVKDSTATTSILKAENDQVVINKPTNIIGGVGITGDTTIKGTTWIADSSDEANDGDLTVAGTGTFNDKLTVTAGGVAIIGNTDITGTTTIKGATQIENSSSEATDGNLAVAGTGTFNSKLTVTSGGAEITGATGIKGNIQISKSSSEAVDGNLKVAGTGEFGGKLTVKGKPMESNDAVRKTELDKTFWLSGGEAISSSANLDSYLNIGNYYCELNDTAKTVLNFPAFIEKQAFTLKVFCGQGVSYITQHIRTYANMEEAERYANYDDIANEWVWGSWVPVSKASYSLQSRQIYNKDNIDKDKWELYKKDKSTLYHLPTLTADDFPETSSKLPTGEDNPDATSTPLFFFCLLALLQPAYGKTDKTYGDSLVGLSNPNEQGNTLIYIYTEGAATATITGKAGTPYTKLLPKYSSGMWIKLNGEVIVFGTTAPSKESLTTNYYCHNIDARYSDASKVKLLTKKEDFVDNKECIKVDLVPEAQRAIHFYTSDDTITLQTNGNIQIPSYSAGMIVRRGVDYTIQGFGNYAFFYYYNAGSGINDGQRFSSVPVLMSKYPQGFTSMGASSGWMQSHQDLKDYAGGKLVTDWVYHTEDPTIKYQNAEIAFVQNKVTKNETETAAHMNIVLDGTVYVQNGIQKVVTDGGSSNDSNYNGIGSGTRPVYLNSNNAIIASNENVGENTKDNVQLIYMKDGSLTKLTENVGSNDTTNHLAKPIYMNGGKLQPISSTIGSSSKPIYMSGGTLTACTYAYTVTDTLPSEPQADTIYFITEG